MGWAYPVSARCFSRTPVTIDAGTLRREFVAPGSIGSNFQNLHAFQDDSGGWHPVLAIGVHSPSHPHHWTVLVHAHPGTGPAPGAEPVAWSADPLLSRSFSNPLDGNHDSKYFEDGGDFT
jgi:hypothetical protein